MIHSIKAKIDGGFHSAASAAADKKMSPQPVSIRHEGHQQHQGSRTSNFAKASTHSNSNTNVQKCQDIVLNDAVQDAISHETNTSKQVHHVQWQDYDNRVHILKPGMSDQSANTAVEASCSAPQETQAATSSSAPLSRLAQLRANLKARQSTQSLHNKESTAALPTPEVQQNFLVHSPFVQTAAVTDVQSQQELLSPTCSLDFDMAFSHIKKEPPPVPPPAAHVPTPDTCLYNNMSNTMQQGGTGSSEQSSFSFDGVSSCQDKVPGACKPCFQIVLCLMVHLTLYRQRLV